LLGLFLVAGAAGAAQARAEPFAGQLSPTSIAGVQLSLDGNRLSGLTVTVRPTRCAPPAVPKDNDDTFYMKMPAGGYAAVKNGRFSYRGAALSEYGASFGGTPLGGRFTFSGTLNAARTVVSGTMKLTGAHDPFESGCSGSYRLLAVPDVPDAVAPLDRSSYQNKDVPTDSSAAYIHFDYAAGVITNLEVDANFTCKGSVDDADVDAKTYGVTRLPTTATGRFSLKAYVLDGYKDPVSLTFTGQVKGKKAGGRVVVAEPPGGFRGDGGDKCAGNYAWTAAKGPPPETSIRLRGHSLPAMI
jgi:hypothetical protein